MTADQHSDLIPSEPPADCDTAMAAPVLPRGWRILALVLPALAVCHFGLIGLTIAAPWAIPLPLQPAVERYLVPFFNQDWRLFSPVPDVNDYAVYARGEYRDGTRLARTPWLSLMDRYVDSMNANRLSTDSVKLEIVHKGALLTTRTASPFGYLPSSRAALAAAWASIDRQPATLIVLERLSSAVLAQAHPDLTFETVQVMIAARRVVPVDGVRPEDGELAIVLEPVPFQAVTR